MALSILITGCSSGIGLHVATQLHQAGFDVLATARQVEDVTNLTAQGIKSHQLDLTDNQSISDGFSWAVEQADNNQVDVLFNNGAYGQPGAIEDLPTDALKAQFETNVFGWHSLTRLTIAHMRKHGTGKIIQNSSILGFIGMPYRGAYNASKYAIEGLSDTLRIELAGSGISVSLIEPGPITSRFRANALVKLEENIDLETSYHSQTYKQTLTRLKKTGPADPFTLPPEAVYKRVQKIINSAKPRPRYYVTTPTYLLGYLKRVLPTRWLDKIIRLSKA